MRNKLLNNVRVITFDATGTLIRFKKHPMQFYREEAIAVCNVDVDHDELQRSFKIAWKKQSELQPHFGLCWRAWWTSLVFNTFQGTSKATAVTPYLNQVAENLLKKFSTTECWDLKSGAFEVIRNLSEMKTQSNFKLGVISNTDSRLKGLLESLEIYPYFDFLVISHEVQHSKPSKEIFNEAIKSSNISSCDASKCLHVGDDLDLDYVGAKNAGWNAILLGDDNKKPVSGEVSHSDIYTSLEELNKYFCKVLMV